MVEEALQVQYPRDATQKPKHVVTPTLFNSFEIRDAVLSLDLVGRHAHGAFMQDDCLKHCSVAQAAGSLPPRVRRLSLSAKAEGTENFVRRRMLLLATDPTLE